MTVPTPPAAVEQPAPLPSEHPAVVPMVIADLQARMDLGIVRYGTPLRPFNGRNTLLDAYQESLDLCVYLRSALIEWAALEERIAQSQVDG